MRIRRVLRVEPVWSARRTSRTALGRGAARGCDRRHSASRSPVPTPRRSCTSGG